MQRVRSTQKFPTVFAEARAKAADEGDGERDAGGGRNEILGGEAHHLGQIAQRAFAAVVLPIGVGGEADSGIESEVWCHGRHARRVERQQPLEAHERVDAQEARGVEQQHGDRIGDPMLLARLVDPGDSVKPALDGAEHRRQERPLALEHSCHETAERNDERGEDREIDRDLNPAINGHGSLLELLGPEQRVGEVDEEAGGHDAGEPIVEDHGCLLRAGRRRRRRRSTPRRSRGRRQAR